MKWNFRISWVMALAVMAFNAIEAQVKLPALISDGAVFQMQAPVKIWGWDKAGTTVTVEFAGKNSKSTADENGKWEVEFPPIEAGGPYTLIVKGTTTVTVGDILSGDVWICSGQSNMELNMNRASPLYGKEIAESKNDRIRYFAAPQTYNFNERVNDYNGGRWQKPDPQSVLRFGALAWFFARELNAQYGIPIGIINTAIGGTPTEAWVSEEAIREFPVHYNELLKFKNQALIDSIEKSDREKSLAWYSEAGLKDKGHLDREAKWMQANVSTDAWDSMEIPGYWTETGIGPVNGIIWFRRTFNVPGYMAGKPAKLLLGRIIDADSVFVNGTFVGTTSYQYPPRRYEIPSGVLKAGENTIVVKVISNRGQGGFVPDKPYYITSGSDTIDLKGEWLFRIGAKMNPTPSGTTVKYKPSGLFNAMISPLLPLRIKGVLWYQGESNAERPVEQRKLFPVLINDWRKNWNQGDFPFLFVQLPNYMDAKEQPSLSNWALFRESQTQALSLPNTAMAVTIDVGEWNDIHPLNKLDVAKRLALAARKIAYHENIVHSGPLFKSMKIKRNRIIIEFTNQGSGLVIKNGEKLNQFAISGTDKTFVWAEASIVKNNKVMVWNDSIRKPVAVRYAWADNPEGANLYNKEGLPASPFRTDNWDK